MESFPGERPERKRRAGRGTPVAGRGFTPPTSLPNISDRDASARTEGGARPVGTGKAPAASPPDGPGAAGLNPKPRNYADAAWQQTVTDEEIEKAIVYGGAAIGKSPQMVGNPDLQAKPGVVAALREKVRKFGKL